MNAVTQQILENLESLPPEMQQETLNFVKALTKQCTQVKSSQPQPLNSGKQVFEIMEKIAQRGTAFSDIEDPVAWQKDIRHDRPLSDRQV